MNKTVKYIILIMLVLLNATFLGCGVPAGEIDSKALDNMCSKYYEDNELTSLSVCIVLDDKVEYFNYGTIGSDMTPVTENTLYEIGSISKVVTGTILAKMVKDGLVSLDEPAQSYLDDAKVMLPQFEGTPIKIIDLVTHTSALPRLPIGIDNPENPYKEFDYQMLYDVLNNEELTYAPGSQYLYSNYAMALLGHILCVIEDMSYDELVSKYLGDIINLQNTAVNLSQEQTDLFALPHGPDGAQIPSWEFQVFAPAGGLKSTASDMSKFMMMHLQNLDTHLLDEAVSLTQQVHFESQPSIGINWLIGNVNYYDFFNHAGETGGSWSYISVVPEQNIGIYIATNCKQPILPLGNAILIEISSNELG